MVCVWTIKLNCNFNANILRVNAFFRFSWFLNIVEWRWSPLWFRLQEKANNCPLYILSSLQSLCFRSLVSAAIHNYWKTAATAQCVDTCWCWCPYFLFPTILSKLCSSSPICFRFANCKEVMSALLPRISIIDNKYRETKCTVDSIRWADSSLRIMH